MTQIAPQTIADSISQLDPNQPDFVSRFEDGLTQLAGFDENETFGLLISLFDDDALFDEPMFAIIRLIELSDTPTYVSLLLGQLDRFAKRSPRWASIVVMRLLNSEKDAIEMAAQIGNASPNARNALAWLLGAINKRGEIFEEKTKSLLDLLEEA